jgi:hypothetical protein
MSNLRLSMVCGEYDITRALLEGSIKPDGIDCPDPGVTH